MAGLPALFAENGSPAAEAIQSLEGQLTHLEQKQQVLENRSREVYGEQLRALRDRASQAGNLAGYMKVDEELSRFEQEGDVPATHAVPAIARLIERIEQARNPGCCAPSQKHRSTAKALYDALKNQEVQLVKQGRDRGCKRRSRSARSSGCARSVRGREQIRGAAQREMGESGFAGSAYAGVGIVLFI